MTTFLEINPTAENHWRAIVLFGRNVASYKFALGEALLRLAAQPSDLIRLDDLALPYARALCQHLRSAPKQATSASSRFLDQCRAFNAGDVSETDLQGVTVQLGFNNVIDAFHRLGPADVPLRFFVDERKTHRGIRITEDLRALVANGETAALSQENEARWRLVETAWALGLNRSLIAFDPESRDLVTQRDGRISVTSSRAALNGYQKGRCFYCFRAISIAPATLDADVDHFFPWALRDYLPPNLDGVWNLVLSCPTCNRGPQGKFDLIPAGPLLERLHRRNEFLITSHHPLRETLMLQTGSSPADRVAFLQTIYDAAVLARVHRWAPADPDEAAF